MNIIIDKHKLNMRDYLVNVSDGEKVIYIPNKGNAGDSLIALGTLQLLDDLGVEYEMFSPNYPYSFDPTGKIVILGGGGNFVDYYTDIHDVLLWLHKKARRVVLLPHTVSGNLKLLSELGSNIDLISRDEVSYQHCMKHARNANNYLSDDMALYIKPKKILKEKKVTILAVLRSNLAKVVGLAEINSIPLKKAVRADVRGYLFCIKSRLINNNICNCFRTDKEKSERELDKINFDASKEFAFGLDDESRIDYASYLMVKHIEKCRIVHTNRLHVCIAASLLEKEVYFYANSYFKNKAVYEFSLKSRFPNTTWCE